MSDYNVKITIRNAPLMRAMRRAGMNSASDLAKSANVSPTRVGQYLAMSIAPYNERGILRPCAQRICDFLLDSVDNLFPVERLNDPLEKNVAELELNYSQVLALRESSFASEKLTIEQSIDNDNIKNGVEKILDKLEKRRADVLRMRFGIGGGEPMTQKDIATVLGCSSGRVQQLERQAMRRIREIGRKMELKNNDVIEYVK